MHWSGDSRLFHLTAEEKRQADSSFTEQVRHTQQNMAEAQKRRGEEALRKLFLQNQLQMYSEGGFSVSRPTEFAMIDVTNPDAAVANPYAVEVDKEVRRLTDVIEAQARNQEKDRTVRWNRMDPRARDEAYKLETERARRVRAALLAHELGQPIGSLIPREGRDAPKTQRILSMNPEEERLRLGAMAYRIGPHPWFGWRVRVDRHDGDYQQFWRPTQALAHKTGHRALERFVGRRRRAWDIAHPKLVTARDRWIVEPTQEEQTAKAQEEWDAQFKSAEEGKK